MKNLGEMTLNEIKDTCEKHLSSDGHCPECPLWIFCMPEGTHDYSPTCWGTELEKKIEVE